MLRASALGVLLAGVAGLAMTTAARAQDAAPANPTNPAQATTAAGTQADDGGFGDIIVTAQKRATNIQDTPIAIRAFSGEEISKAGVSDLNGLARLAPDLGITNDTIFTKVAIRGVSSVDISESSDPALTISIDGEYINRPVSLNASFFDLERIEVLRGPQGTLYGRNSTAGALNIIAAKPKLGKVEGYVSGAYGNYDAAQIEGALNLPIGEVAAIRIGGLHTQHDGYTDNGAVGRGDDANVDAVRASIAFEPGRLKAYLAGEYVNVDQTAPSQFGINVTGATPGLVALPKPGPAYTDPLSYTVPSRVDLPEGFDSSSFPLGNLGFLKSKQYAVRGRLEYDFGPATIAYIGGYRDSKTASVQPLNGYLPENATFYNPSLDSKTQSHELRVSGGQEGVFVWQAGGFYFKETQFIERGFFLPLAAGGSYFNYFFRDVKAESKAAFGQATYWLSPDTLSVTGGIRYTDDKKSALFTNFPARFGLGSTPPTLATPGATQFRPASASDQITWNVGVDYKPGLRNLIYAKVSKGYKSGGFDNIGQFEPEQIIAYEAGSKNEFANGTVQLNVAAFYYDYTDQQVQVFDPVLSLSSTKNAGKSRVWGIETDMGVLLSDDDTFHATVNYLNAELTDFAGVQIPTVAAQPAGQPPLTVNLKGNHPPQAPQWTIALGYDHVFHLGDAKIVAGAYSRFKSDYYLGVFNFEGDRVKAFTQTDLSLQYVAPDNRFSIQAYARNLENKRIKAYSGFGGGNNYNWIFGAPRTYGIQGRFNF